VIGTRACFHKRMRMVDKNDSASISEERLLSLDVFRGLTMFLLVAGGTGLFSQMNEPAFDGTIIGAIGSQLRHHTWSGLRFWDLVQPFFMFIVGVALPFSVCKRIERGDSHFRIFRHVLVRSSLLLLLGWGLACIGAGKITFLFHNVLAQLSVTYLLAFLVMKRSVATQLAFSIFLLLITELAYRFFPVEGFNHPFVPDKNFGAYVDLLISRELSRGHWVAINALPTAAHTIWGVIAGKLLMSDRAHLEKIKTLVIAGAVGLVAGYALSPVTPIVKRIATSSFVIVSGGWCVLALAFLYWLIDVKKIRKWSVFFTIVGMNPLFIYLFTNAGGNAFLHKIAKPFTMALFAWSGELYAQIATSLVVLGLLWYICYWLYKRRIFIKL
jgi:predicted acyltransferase